MKLADLSMLGIAAELDQDGNLLIEAPKGAMTSELLVRIREAKPGLVAELRVGGERCELGELHGYLCGPKAENTTPTPKVHTPPPELNDPNAMIQVAAGGLMTPDALRRALGTEGVEDLTAGDLSAEVLRFFAESVANRWAHGAVLPDEVSDAAKLGCSGSASGDIGSLGVADRKPTISSANQIRWAYP